MSDDTQRMKDIYDAEVLTLRAILRECAAAAANYIEWFDVTPGWSCRSEHIADMAYRRLKLEAALTRAREGLTHPADVQPGAVKELVEAARQILLDWDFEPEDAFRLRQALAALGIKEAGDADNAPWMEGIDRAD